MKEEEQRGENTVDIIRYMLLIQTPLQRSAQI